jgi:threonine/homoserine/homoserine lactone efflux protein
MLLLFGRFKEPARAALGIAALVVGIVIHQVVVALAGGALLVWGAVRLLYGCRNRGHGNSQDGAQDDERPR